MSSQLWLALVAGAISLVSATYASTIAKRQAQFTRRQDEEQRQREKAESVAELMARYRQPLLQAAFDLQSRMFNIVRQGFLARYYGDDRVDTQEYARANTLYVIAEYLGWVEILRHEVQFLDTGDEDQNRTWVELLQEVKFQLLTDRHGFVLQILTGQQRAIGQVMVDDDPGGQEHRTCCGYAEFIIRLRDNPDFSRWFDRLGNDVDLLAESLDGRIGRLVGLQNALIDLIDFLDPDCSRLPGSGREKATKLALGESVESATEPQR